MTKPEDPKRDFDIDYHKSFFPADDHAPSERPGFWPWLAVSLYLGGAVFIVVTMWALAPEVVS